jgi:hypothetical protein
VPVALAGSRSFYFDVFVVVFCKFWPAARLNSFIYTKQYFAEELTMEEEISGQTWL